MLGDLDMRKDICSHRQEARASHDHASAQEDPLGDDRLLMDLAAVTDVVVSTDLDVPAHVCRLPMDSCPVDHGVRADIGPWADIDSPLVNQCLGNALVPSHEPHPLGNQHRRMEDGPRGDKIMDRGTSNASAYSTPIWIPLVRAFPKMTSLTPEKFFLIC